MHGAWYNMHKCLLYLNKKQCQRATLEFCPFSDWLWHKKRSHSYFSWHLIQHKPATITLPSFLFPLYFISHRFAFNVYDYDAANIYSLFTVWLLQVFTLNLLLSFNITQKTQCRWSSNNLCFYKQLIYCATSNTCIFLFVFSVVVLYVQGLGTKEWREVSETNLKNLKLRLQFSYYFSDAMVNGWDQKAEM